VKSHLCYRWCYLSAHSYQNSDRRAGRQRRPLLSLQPLSSLPRLLLLPLWPLYQPQPSRRFGCRRFFSCGGFLGGGLLRGRFLRGFLSGFFGGFFCSRFFSLPV
jgi:hypothetical protein